MAELPVRPESESVKLVSRGPAPVAFTTRKPWSTYWTATFDSSDPTTKNSPAETAVRGARSSLLALRGSVHRVGEELAIAVRFFERSRGMKADILMS